MSRGQTEIAKRIAECGRRRLRLNNNAFEQSRIDLLVSGVPVGDDWLIQRISAAYSMVLLL